MRQRKLIQILITLFAVIFSCRTFAQKKIETSYEYSNHQILIYYQFQGDSTSEYDVSVKLKKTSDPSFSLTPELITGDVGKGKFAGMKREIIWHLSQKEEKSLTGNDYYFEVTANKITSSGGVAWYVYVGGVILGGGTAAVLLLNKKHESTTTNATFTFPGPPGRPN